MTTDEQLQTLTAENARLAEELREARADSERLDWLENEYDSMRGISTLGLWLLEKVARRKHLNPLRVAIDKAKQAQDAARAGEEATPETPR